MKTDNLAKSLLSEDSKEQLNLAEESEDRRKLQTPPDGGYGWVIVIASFLCNMVVDGTMYAFGIFLLPFEKYFGEGKGKIAWAGSLLTGMCFIVGPIVGGLCNKYGCRAVCIAGSVIGCVAFILSTLSPNVECLMLTYGFMCGIGFGMIILPAAVCVGYYFETKRSLATGIAVCGSGFGAFSMAPIAQILVDNFTWQEANLILAWVILSCTLCGATMIPLEHPGPADIVNDNRDQTKRYSLTGPFFMVELPDGTLQKVMAVPPINIDPGVHSTLCLDQLTSTTTVKAPPQVLLPVTERKTSVTNSNKSVEVFTIGESEKLKDLEGKYESLEVEMENRFSSFLNDNEEKVMSEVENKTFSTLEPCDSKQEQPEGIIKKDVDSTLISQQMQDYQSKQSLPDYHESNKSILKQDTDSRDKLSTAEDRFNPCSYISSMVDFSLLNEPIFLYTGISNFFAFAALYIPFVYIIDHSLNNGYTEQQGSLIISVIGFTSTIGRVVCGWISDFPRVNSVYFYNCGLLLAALSVASIPFCHSYLSFIAMAVSYGMALAIFISLTTIILVDLLGLERLTNSYGLLLLFRGVATLIGSPIAGSVYDATGTYTYPFFMAAIFYLIASVLSFAVPFLKKDPKVKPKLVIMSSLPDIHEDKK